MQIQVDRMPNISAYIGTVSQNLHHYSLGESHLARLRQCLSDQGIDLDAETNLRFWTLKGENLQQARLPLMELD